MTPSEKDYYRYYGETATECCEQCGRWHDINKNPCNRKQAAKVAADSGPVD